jgi:hypothetical protein
VITSLWVSERWSAGHGLVYSGRCRLVQRTLFASRNIVKKPEQSFSEQAPPLPTILFNFSTNSGRLSNTDSKASAGDYLIPSNQHQFSSNQHQPPVTKYLRTSTHRPPPYHNFQLLNPREKIIFFIFLKIDVDISENL